MTKSLERGIATPREGRGANLTEAGSRHRPPSAEGRAGDLREIRSEDLPW